MSDDKNELEDMLRNISVTHWVRPVSGIILDGIKIDLDTLEQLSEQDAFGTDFGAAPILIDRDAEQVLLKHGLVNKRTRGSVYGNEKLDIFLNQLTY